VNIEGWRDRLKDLPRRAGGQRKLAEKAGVPLRSLAGWINDGVEPPAAKLAAIATAAGVSLDWIMFGREGPPLDEPLLSEVVTVIEREATQQGNRPSPDKYAALVLHVYQVVLGRAADERRAAAPDIVRQAFRLIS
jgi:transcriptional regulator with XRE-family HTH domain